MRIGISCVKYGLGQHGGVQMFLREFLKAIDKYDQSQNEYVLIFSQDREVPTEVINSQFNIFTINPPKEINIIFRLLKRLLKNTQIYNFLPGYSSEIVSDHFAKLRLLPLK